MRDHRDNTADAAVSSANREWREMARLAVRVRKNNGSPVWIDEQEKKFTGIYKRLLTDPMEELYKEAL